MSVPTKREAAALGLFQDEGRCNEGMMANLWPLIRRPRAVLNGLLEKGLVELDSWIDDEAGYELRLTQAGRAWLEARS